LKPDEFWELSWFEWTLYLNKFNRSVEKEKARREETWEQVRTMWQLLMKAHFNENVKRTDLIKLSFDKEVDEVEEQREDPLERVKRLYGSRLDGIK
jgi:hypothetical protein